MAHKIYEGSDTTNPGKYAAVEKACHTVGALGFLDEATLLAVEVMGGVGSFTSRDGRKINFDRSYSSAHARTVNAADDTPTLHVTSTYSDDDIARELPDCAQALAALQPIDSDDLPLLKLALNYQAGLNDAKLRRQNPSRGHSAQNRRPGLSFATGWQEKSE